MATAFVDLLMLPWFRDRITRLLTDLAGQKRVQQWWKRMTKIVHEKIKERATIPSFGDLLDVPRIQMRFFKFLADQEGQLPSMQRWHRMVTKTITGIQSLRWKGTRKEYFTSPHTRRMNSPPCWTRIVHGVGEQNRVTWVDLLGPMIPLTEADLKKMGLAKVSVE